jgi:5-carboxymethyl-2-hydroxymuconate isomerase
MPHLWIEYSANLDEVLEMDEFMHHVHGEVVADGVFPLAGLRTRVVRVEQYVIADDHPDNAFVHIVLRTLPGRDVVSKKASTDRLFAAIRSRLAPLSASRPLAISMHVEESDPEFGYRISNYREHMAERAQAVVVSA